MKKDSGKHRGSITQKNAGKLNKRHGSRNDERDKNDKERKELEKNIETQLSSTKSSNVDAQRVLNIIDLARRKMEILRFIDSGFIKHFWPRIQPEIDDDFMGALPNNQLLDQLSPQVLQLLKNQGIFERQFHLFIIDFEEAQQLKADQENDGEIEEMTKDQKRRVMKCKRNLQNNTRNLVRFLLKNEHDLTIIKELKSSSSG